MKIDENILKITLSLGAIGAVDAVDETVSCSTVVGKVYSSNVSSWPESLEGDRVGCRHGVSNRRVVA